MHCARPPASHHSSVSRDLQTSTEPSPSHPPTHLKSNINTLKFEYPHSKLTTTFVWTVRTGTGEPGSEPRPDLTKIGVPDAKGRETRSRSPSPIRLLPRNIIYPNPQSPSALKPAISTLAPSSHTLIHPLLRRLLHSFALSTHASPMKPTSQASIDHDDSPHAGGSSARRSVTRFEDASSIGGLRECKGRRRVGEDRADPTRAERRPPTHRRTAHLDPPSRFPLPVTPNTRHRDPTPNGGMTRFELRGGGRRAGSRSAGGCSGARAGGCEEKGGRGKRGDEGGERGKGTEGGRERKEGRERRKDGNGSWRTIGRNRRLPSSSFQLEVYGTRSEGRRVLVASGCGREGGGERGERRGRGDEVNRTTREREEGSGGRRGVVGCVDCGTNEKTGGRADKREIGGTNKRRRRTTRDGVAEEGMYEQRDGQTSCVERRGWEYPTVASPPLNASAPPSTPILPSTERRTLRPSSPIPRPPSYGDSHFPAPFVHHHPSLSLLLNVLHRNYRIGTTTGVCVPTSTISASTQDPASDRRRYGHRPKQITQSPRPTRTPKPKPTQKCRRADLPIHPDVSGLLSSYLDDSRAGDIEYAYRWISFSQELVLWIHASVGMGKSTFARELAEKLRSKGQLAAALFLSFAPADWGPETMIRLLAGEIGRTHPQAIPSIADAIENYSGPSLPLRLLFDQYIQRPIQSLQLPHPLIILVDAIDEWKTYPLFIKQFTTIDLSRDLVKFIILGRAVPSERDFPGVSMSLYPLPPASKEVISRYFHAHFATIDWGNTEEPEERQVSQLAEKANGLFVWAWIVFSTIADDFIDASPKEVLEQTLESRRITGDSELLAELYHGAIMRSFPRAKEREQLVYPANVLFHLSVAEYFLSPSVSDGCAFSIRVAEGHAIVGGGCMALLPKFFAGNAEELPPQDALYNYVVLTWPGHVASSFPSLVTVPDAEVWKQSELYGPLQSLASETVHGWAKALQSAVKDGRSSNVACLEEAETGPLLCDLGVELSDDHNMKLANLGVACLELAVRLLPHTAENWDELGRAHSGLAKLTCSRQSAEAAIAIHRHAVELVSLDPGADEEAVKRGLAGSLRSMIRCQQSPGAVCGELEEAISLGREAMRLEGAEAERAAWLHNLASSIDERFRITRSIEDQEEIIALDREALKLRPEGHQYRANSLHNLANSLRKRFDVTSSLDELEESISLDRQALQLRPEDHRDRARSLHNLASSLRQRFDVTSSLGDLKESISLDREALKLRPEGSQARALSLHNLAISLRKRFDVTSSLDDLEESISLDREAFTLRPEGHQDRAETLHNLASSLRKCFGVTSCLNDLEESITMDRAALELRPEGHRYRGYSLHNLTISLRRRFDVTSSLGDIEESISLGMEALKLRPQGHRDRAESLHNFASLLRKRFGVTSCLDDLQWSITLDREALELRPDSHRDRALSLHNLSNSFRKRFDAIHSLDDLEESISLDRQALKLRPEGHRDRAESLNNLASSLRKRFDVTDSLDNLEESIRLDREALETRHGGHRDRTLTLRNLANSLRKRFGVTSCLDDLEESTQLDQEALKN
ncbi:hypothetical protein FA13DRAFT_1908572 [Coprinellus micaceus]|uniref:Nephrocystin 3-like N-terminal domain-containing protein n=1 Tax=Coprinellus micaceus TaxID=71717 RepID=A0A4Y7SS21_COPMI|nr:hypothetical protein FA13DRAFT_1908572 [Coprinellus micaceus]